VIPTKNRGQFLTGCSPLVANFAGRDLSRFQKVKGGSFGFIYEVPDLFRAPQNLWISGFRHCFPHKKSPRRGEPRAVAKWRFWTKNTPKIFQNLDVILPQSVISL
jgi:hypothetical protein